jgi:lipoprotein-anchoring transpeptidase ErfK/SrfK
VRVYTRYRVGQQPPLKPSGNIVAVIVFIAIIVGIGWLVRKEWKRRHSRTHQSVAITNGIATPARQAQVAVPAPKPIAATAVLTNAASAKAAAVFEAQVALDRAGFSPGSIDGVLGSQTRSALRAFQSREGLPVTGELDAETRARLTLGQSALTAYTVIGSESARLIPIATTWLGKSEQPRLDFETLLEMVAERSHSHPNLIRRLNPSVNWDSVPPGAELLVPSTQRLAPPAKAAFLQIRLSDRTLEAFDASERLLAHFPCSIAARVEKRPVGELHVAVTAPNPNYTFDPAVFPESAEAREIGRKLILPPGPNNPVGTVWIGLDKPGYGIHGTPRPEEVGRTESHGCFRLANWNAEYLLQLVTVGTPVRVEP